MRRAWLYLVFALIIPVALLVMLDRRCRAAGANGRDADGNREWRRGRHR